MVGTRSELTHLQAELVNHDACGGGVALSVLGATRCIRAVYMRQRSLQEPLA